MGRTSARLHIAKVVAAPILDDAIKVSRRLYLNRLQDIFRPQLKNLHPEWNDFKLSNEASETAKNEFSKGLKKWFGVSAEDFATWLTSAESTAPTTTASQESPAEADATDEDSAPEDSFPTIDELITDD